MNTQLQGKTLYVPGMDYAASRLFCSVFKAFGINAVANVNSDSKTIEIGSRYTSGEECLPEKVTIGDFMKVVLADGFDPDKNVFFIFRGILLKKHIQGIAFSLARIKKENKFLAFNVFF